MHGNKLKRHGLQRLELRSIIYDLCFKFKLTRDLTD